MVHNSHATEAHIERHRTSIGIVLDASSDQVAQRHVTSYESYDIARDRSTMSSITYSFSQEQYAKS
jgi:hypothetical protein